MRLLEVIEQLQAKRPKSGPRCLRDLIRFAVSTGLRRGELINLRWGDLDLEGGFLIVRNRTGFTTKSGHERRVPLVGDAREVASRLAAGRKHDRRTNAEDRVFTSDAGQPLDPDYLSKRFRHYREKAGLSERLHLHSLRHTAASWLVMRGVPLSVVQAILGHADLATTQRYSHLAPSTLRDEMERALKGVNLKRDDS